MSVQKSAVSTEIMEEALHPSHNWAQKNKVRKWCDFSGRETEAHKVWPQWTENCVFCNQQKNFLVLFAVPLRVNSCRAACCQEQCGTNCSPAEDLMPKALTPMPKATQKLGIC